MYAKAEGRIVGNLYCTLQSILLFCNADMHAPSGVCSLLTCTFAFAAAGQHRHCCIANIAACAGPECQNAVLAYCGAWLSVIVSSLLAVTYAARRRTMLREKFGIAGVALLDCLCR